MSDVYGTFNLIDTTHISHFLGYIGYGGYLHAVDTTHIAPMTGLVINDSTTFGTDTTYNQNSILGRGDQTAIFADWTYSNGTLNVDGTWVDGTFGWQWYDPVQLYYSVYNQDTADSDATLIGYKFREPVRNDVGNYYASMVTPETPGHYLTTWTWLKDNSSYAKRESQPFTNMSGGLDAMKDYPGSDSTAGD